MMWFPGPGGSEQAAAGDEGDAVRGRVGRSLRLRRTEPGPAIGHCSCST